MAAPAAAAAPLPADEYREEEANVGRGRCLEDRQGLREFDMAKERKGRGSFSSQTNSTKQIRAGAGGE